MSAHPFFATPAVNLAAFWTSNSISLSDSEDTSYHRYRHHPALPNSPVASDQPPLPFFLTLPPPNATTRTQPSRRPEGYRATATRIERALESANTALNDAQEALETRNTRTYYDRVMPPIVDLTAASPTRSPELHRQHDGRAGHSAQPHTTIMTPLNDLPAGWDLQRDYPPVDRSGPGGCPEFEAAFQILGQTDRERERRAIERQREARALWDSNQRRREALLTRRSRSRSPRQSSPLIRQRFESYLPSGSSSSRPKSESPVESIDLTNMDEKTSAADILAGHGSDAAASQKVTFDTGRTPLTSYKCPICMETPTDITATICGHLFCHRCIIETLKWSEDQRGVHMPGRRAKGVCPVCRKELGRLDTDQKGRTLVPLSVMLTQHVRQQQRADVKGKGVARDQSGVENRNRESSADWIGRLVNLDDT